MAMKKVWMFFCMMALMTASCTKEVEFDGQQTDPKLVVNGVQQVGQPARLCVERSVFFMDAKKDCRVKDLQVDMYVNGVFKEQLSVRDSLHYESYFDYQTDSITYKLDYAFNYCEGRYILCEGDVLRFEVSSSEFEEKAIAETTMPVAPQEVSFDTVRVESYADGYGMKVSFALKINDPNGENYYNLRPDDGLSGFTSTDMVFQEMMTIEDVGDAFGQNDYYGNGNYNVFSDVLFNGKEYTVSMQVTQSGEEFYEPFTLEVSCVDVSLYQYIKSYNSYSQSDPEGLVGMFTEPVQVYSNVRNGIGLVGAQSLPVTFTIDLTVNNTSFVF